jgi:asparagine synthase (glutamine-hydrolyzing)
MCGIFGVVGHVSLELAGRCLDRLAHRGPDGRGLLALPGCVLGHRRLSILDVSDAGAQPMLSPCGRYAMVYNGEVYNYRELRAELEAKGEVFRTGTDSEVVLRALMLHGPKALERMNGMWALALWDTVERRLFLSRDRFGKKPLFWAHTPQGLCFASEMKALLPLLPTRTPHPELTRSSRRIMSYEATEECLITEIRRFPAGCWATTRGEDLTPVRWWLTLDHLETVPTSFTAQAERFRELFLDACRLRMRSDVPLGVALSGGFDSSATLCAMAHIAGQIRPGEPTPDWRNAFTAGFPGTPLDETEKAALTARHAGALLHQVPQNPADIPHTLLRDLWLLEEQHLTLPSPFVRLYQAVRAQGVKVTLDGHGADECLAGYGFDFLQAMHDAGPVYWPGIAQTYRNSLPRHPQFPRPSIGTLLWRHLRNRAAQRPAQAFGGPHQEHPAWQGMGRLGRILYHSFHHTILPTLLRNYDRYAMAAGVEVRMPFMDHRLVSYCFSLPWNSKVRGGFSKAVARQGLRGIVPDAIRLDTVKLGFNAPMADWVRGPLRIFFQDTVSSRSFRESDLVDQKLATGRLNGLLETGTPSFAQAEACWTAFIPYFWEQAFLKERGSGEAAPVTLG